MDGSKVGEIFDTLKSMVQIVRNVTYSPPFYIGKGLREEYVSMMMMQGNKILKICQTSQRDMEELKRQLHMHNNKQKKIEVVFPTKERVFEL